jgi:hypothetical protein
LKKRKSTQKALDLSEPLTQVKLLKLVGIMVTDKLVAVQSGPPGAHGIFDPPKQVLVRLAKNLLLPRPVALSAGRIESLLG